MEQNYVTVTLCIGPKARCRVARDGGGQVSGGQMSGGNVPHSADGPATYAIRGRRLENMRECRHRSVFDRRGGGD